MTAFVCHVVLLLARHTILNSTMQRWCGEAAAGDINLYKKVISCQLIFSCAMFVFAVQDLRIFIVNIVCQCGHEKNIVCQCQLLKQR